MAFFLETRNWNRFFFLFTLNALNIRVNREKENMDIFLTNRTFKPFSSHKPIIVVKDDKIYRIFLFSRILVFCNVYLIVARFWRKKRKETKPNRKKENLKQFNFCTRFWGDEKFYTVQRFLSRLKFFLFIISGYKCWKKSNFHFSVSCWKKDDREKRSEMSGRMDFI